MKKFGKYLVITLLLLIGLGAVGVLYLFFVPNSSLFNITYINMNKTLHSEKFNKDDVAEIVLNSRAYDVVLLHSNDNNIHADLHCNSFGFVLTKNKTPNITATLKDSVLTINVKEPYGFATHNNSYINLYVPIDKTFDLTLTNLKSDVLCDSSKLVFNNLTYSTTSGDFDFLQGSVLGKMDLTLGKGVFTMTEKVVTNSNNLTLNVTTGKFYAEKTVFGDIEIKSNTRGIINVKECVRIVENVPSAGGQINIEKAKNVFIVTSDSNINIGEVPDGADITLSGAGNVNITTLKAFSTILTNSGSINIQNAESELIVKSDSGNITVNSAKTIVKTSTNYGDIVIHFSQDAAAYDESSRARSLYAVLKNGKLTATGVEHVGSSAISDEQGIVITGNGRVNLTMRDVKGANSIQGANGSVNLVVGDEVVGNQAQYILTTSSTAGNVRVNLSQTEHFEGYTTRATTVTSVNCSSSSNSLTVSTLNGDLQVLDYIMSKNGF